ncbi:TPA: hypothetical protein DDZ86_02595 [Candidatus Dependentiae bacterium]|nr:MAG: hypothetical protein UW09_C0001G0129 [candidate division TM6 bacterium GW2011_GWF2_43_87]HBL98508.1 hypothetical protein [Candidatus Dependentiae bacterium]
MTKMLWLLLLVPLSLCAKEKPIQDDKISADPIIPQTTLEKQSEQAQKIRSVGIAFDLHGVLFKFDYGGAVSLALSYGTVVTLVQRMFGFKGLLISLAPVLLPLTYGSLRYGWFFLKHGFVPTVEHHIFGGPGITMWTLRKVWLWLASLYLPRTNLINLVWRLKHRGYKIILASNVGPEALEELRKYYPESFSRDGHELFDGIWQPCHDTDWKTKPHQDFFIELKKECLLKWPDIQELLFIDNRKRNLKSAIRSDTQPFYTPILFSGTAKLEKDLKTLKIM